MKVRELTAEDTEGIRQMSRMATDIVREYYDPLIGKEQNDYMLARFQSEAAIAKQLAEGYRYFFALDGDRQVGFFAIYPRGSAMYLSKFYLYRQERRRGYGRQIIGFIAVEARKQGLTAIELNVNKRNESRFAYERMGFEILRPEKIDIGGGFFMDDYVYRLELE
ncbi:MAG: GNAT family N-acetyltransferase [Abditibacteriota bacterium]|nr:GNAT family N-acetyltransferase [Abditibacteriota bacterium]